MDNCGKDFFDFISENIKKDPNSLRLSSKKDKYSFDVEFAITQIECRKRNALKLKAFLVNPYFLFPDSISGEQASHQAIGIYHASLAEKSKTILDMTAGLGIDSLSFAQRNHNVTSIELIRHKAEILNKNAETLGIRNIKIVNEDSIEFLRNDNIHYDMIFIDPSRRDSSKQRVYNLRDCSPDVIKYQSLLEERADRIFIKASSLLDISQTIKDFKNIKTIKAVGVKGECKELLIELGNDSKDKSQEPLILEAINLDNQGNVLSSFADEITEKPFISYMSYASTEDIEPDYYLLEPSPMVMKIAPWNKICQLYNAKKLGKSSNIFISSKKPKEFPGRVTKIIKTLTKQDRKSLKGFPATVVSKNHPLSADEIRKIFRLKEGDENFIYSTRLGEKPIFLLTSKI